MKIAGSGSGSESGSLSQRHGSADPDSDPQQNVIDPEHWKLLHILPPWSTKIVKSHKCVLLGAVLLPGLCWPDSSLSRLHLVSGGYSGQWVHFRRLLGSLSTSWRTPWDHKYISGGYQGSEESRWGNSSISTVQGVTWVSGYIWGGYLGLWIHLKGLPG
jgi:hypothetical protein